MRCIPYLSVVVFTAAVACWANAVWAGPLVAPGEALPPEEQLKKFKLPPGFEIQLVASEPDIQKPMNLAFDARGRLWVTHSTEYPFPAGAGDRPRDGLTILDGIGPGGRATKVTKFADDLNIPIGILPWGDGCEAIVWSIPHIWKLADRDGDGVADRREVLYGPFGYDDTHGNQNAFRLGLDGWVYACHGFRNQSAIKLRGQGDVVLTLQSGNTYRFRPDGSAIEQVSWGQVNPFGSCFDPLGNFFTVDCHSKPLTLVLRGGCYDSFGKPHDGLGFAPLTTRHDHGSTGIAGVAYYAADQFPAEFRNCIYVGNVVTNTVHRDKPDWRGSSPWVDRPQDFITCQDDWFRPVDIQLGPDGALYVADFYNCIIGHYEVDLRHPRRDRFRGRIWRVVWKGTDGGAAGVSPRVDLTTLSGEQLADELAGPNLAVRTAATHEFTRRFGPEVVPAVLPRCTTATQQAHAVWLHFQHGLLTASTAQALADNEPIVRVHLVRALAEMPRWEPWQVEMARRMLGDEDPFVRRAAAEALGRHPGIDNIKPLLGVWMSTRTDDAQLIHTARIALRNQLRDSSNLAQLRSVELTAEEGPRLAEIALAVPSETAAEFAFNFVRQNEVSPEMLAQCLRHVAKQVGEPRLDEVANFVRSRFDADIPRQASLCQSLVDGLGERGAKLNAESPLGQWAAGLASVLLDPTKPPAADELNISAPHLMLALQLAEQLPLQRLSPRVLQLLEDPNADPSVRAAAGATLVTLDRPACLQSCERLVRGSGEPATLRIAAAQLLGSADSEQSRAALADGLPGAAPGVERALALALCATPAGAERLLAAIGNGKSTPRLLQDDQVLRRLHGLDIPNRDQRIAELTAGLLPVDEAIRQLIAERIGGYRTAQPSVAAGQALFTKHCAACHRVADDGGQIGPQLDGIGQRGIERLVEDILDPNRHVDAAFRSTIVLTASGRVLTGLRLREEGQILVLADSQGEEMRVDQADIEESRQSNQSPMPANFGEQIPEEDFHHLLAFLLSQQTLVAAAP